MTLRMVGPWLAVEYSKRSASHGGVLLPQSSGAAHHREALVVAVGPGRLDEDGEHVPIGVEPGDRILFSIRGVEVEVDGRDLMLMKESNVLCRVT